MCFWSPDNKMVALSSRHGVVIASPELGELASVAESGRIKSGAWDPAGVFVYTTESHIKVRVHRAYVRCLTAIAL